MGPSWGRQDPDGPHVGPINLAIWVPLLVHQPSSRSKQCVCVFVCVHLYLRACVRDHVAVQSVRKYAKQMGLLPGVLTPCSSDHSNCRNPTLQWYSKFIMSVSWSSKSELCAMCYPLPLSRWQWSGSSSFRLSCRFVLALLQYADSFLPWVPDSPTNLYSYDES